MIAIGDPGLSLSSTFPTRSRLMSRSSNVSRKTGASLAPASPELGTGSGPVPLVPRSGTPLGIRLEQESPPERVLLD